MKKGKHKLVTILLFVSMVFLAILSKVTSVKAADEPKVILPSTEEVYAVAPKGVKLKDYVVAPTDYENTSTGVKDAFKSSNAFYLVGDSSNPYANQSDIIQLLHSTSTRTTQIGSFWGNIKDSDGARTYNYFDLNKDQELSAWVYNGDSTATAPGNDGFAFVLQTDPNGVQAISRSKGAPVGGETLGVWGGGSVDNKTLPSKMMTTDPINNGVAIEFDRILNQTAGTSSNKLNNYMDSDDFTTTDLFAGNQLKDNHISWGYPGNEEDIYQTKSYGVSSTDYYYYYMKHRRPVKNRITLSGYEDEFWIPAGSKADPRLGWRHIQIKYKASTSSLTYIFNDRFVDGTPKIASTSATLTIDKSVFTSNRAYWGFTAATGSPSSIGQDLAMVMEKMPAVADIRTSTLLTDESNGETSANSNKVASSDGDDLKFDYNLTYAGGLASSGDIKATIALPEHVDYDGDDSGNIGKIIYTTSDGSTAEKEINKSEIKEITITVPGASTVDLPTYKKVSGIEVTIPALANIGDVAKVEIKGKAHAPESTTIKTTTVAAAHAAFESDNYVGNDMSPAFTITNEKLQIASTNDLNQSAKNNETVHFKGTASYAMGSTFDGKSLKANVQVYDEDGKSINADMLGDIDIASGLKTGTFDIPYDLTDLEGGKTYTFKVTLVDSVKRASNTLVYTVKVADIKKLNLTKDDYDPTLVERSQELSFNPNLTYDDNSDVNPADITTYLQVDDETPISGKLSQTTIGNSVPADFTIKSNSLSLGEHKVKVYATDGKRTSNVVEYDFRVIEHGLVLTPDEETINVRNNDPVNLGWNVQYSSDYNENPQITKKVYKTELKIKNEGDSDFRDFYFLANDDDGNEIVNGEISTTTNGDFDFDVNPINFSKITPGAKLEYLDQLKEGRNEIKFQVSDGTVTSEEKTVIVNVPKLTPSLTSSRKIVYLRGGASQIYVPMKFEYMEDSTYTTRIGQIPMLGTLDNGKTAALVANVPTLDEGPPMTFDARVITIPLGLNTDGSPYTLHISVSDPYGRKGEDYDLILKVESKLLELEVSNELEFEDISFRDQKDAYINRQGNWKIAVDSLGTKWNLQAQSAGLFNNQDSSYQEPLVFLDKDGQEEVLTGNPIIAQRIKAATVQDEIEDITEDWGEDDGILLKNSMPNLASEYNGQIQWTLTEAP